MSHSSPLPPHRLLALRAAHTKPYRLILKTQGKTWGRGVHPGCSKAGRHDHPLLGLWIPEEVCRGAQRCARASGWCVGMCRRRAGVCRGSARVSGHTAGVARGCARVSGRRRCAGVWRRAWLPLWERARLPGHIWGQARVRVLQLQDGMAGVGCVHEGVRLDRCDAPRGRHGPYGEGTRQGVGHSQRWASDPRLRRHGMIHGDARGVHMGGGPSVRWDDHIIERLTCTTMCNASHGTCSRAHRGQVRSVTRAPFPVPWNKPARKVYHEVR